MPSRGTRTSKAKKDKNAPKRAMSSYMYFSQDKREEVKAKHPTLKTSDLAKKLGEEWSVLEPEKKKEIRRLSCQRFS